MLNENQIDGSGFNNFHFQGQNVQGIQFMPMQMQNKNISQIPNGGANYSSFINNNKNRIFPIHNKLTIYIIFKLI